MKRLQMGITLIILGNLLSFAYICFCGNEASDFGNFTSGLLLGLSIGCNIVGIILTIAFMSKNNTFYLIDRLDT